MHSLRLRWRVALFVSILLNASPAWARPLMIAAASSLEETVREVANTFKKQHPKVALAFNFAGSHVLARQVEAGAPIDILLSADAAIVSDLAKKNLVMTPTPLFSSQLVVIAAPGTNLALKSPQDLLQPAVKTIALGTPSVPAGRYAAAYLEKAGLLAKLAPKITESENVRATLTLVTKGRAQVGIVYRTDLAIAKPAPRVAWEVPVTETPPIIYAGAVTKWCPTPKVCEDFLTHVVSPEAQQVFQKAGFLTNPAQ